MELRKPCTHASEAVTFSVIWYEAPRESVFVMIPGAWALKSRHRIGNGVGVVQVAAAEGQAIRRLVLGTQRHGEDTAPSKTPIAHLLAEELGIGIVDIAEVDVDQGSWQALVGNAPGKDLREARLEPDAAADEIGRRCVEVPLFLPDRALVREADIPVFVDLVEKPELKPAPQYGRALVAAGNVGSPNWSFGPAAKKAGLKLGVPEVMMGPPPTASRSVS